MSGGDKKAPAASRLQELFTGRSKKALLMPYTTGGYPNIDACREVMKAFIAGGADMIELGVPFSDPLADGPVVQASTQRALDEGVTPGDVLKLAGEFTGTLPIVLMVYYNCVISGGQEKFIEEAAAQGISGLIVPDLPVDEASGFMESCRAHGIDPILLVAPTSPDSRIELIAASASGFIYCVSVAGVTGARSSLSEQLPDFLGRVRAKTDVPLAVGFGVSTPEHAAVVAKHADGVIIGSRLITMIGEAPNTTEACLTIEKFLKDVNEVLK